MTKKELQGYYWTQRNIEKLERRLEELFTAATKTTTQLRPEPTRGTETSDKVGNLVAEMDKVKDDIQGQLERAYALMLRVEQAIEILPAREKYLIRARYIELKGWEEICVDMGVSWRKIHYIHASALKIIA